MNRNSVTLDEDLINAINCTNCLIEWNDGEPYIDKDGLHDEANKKLADLLQIPVVRVSWTTGKPDGILYEPDNNRGYKHDDDNR